ncbi:MAG: dephospho-CoA kinase [Cyanobacteria bacterium J06650_10]
MGKSIERTASGQTASEQETSEQAASTQRIIGLTGGIATGKSTVSDYLAEQHGLPVLDADVYSRQAVAKGGKILDAIAHRYGPTILLSDQTLNRPALGKIIFNNPTEKTWIEQQIHPFVRAKFNQETESYPTNQTLVYSIPLLFEANLTHLVTEIWVVFCTAEQQKQRLMQRNQLAEQAAQVRIEAQMDLKEKCKRADHLLDNSQTTQDLFHQIDVLLNQ